MKRLIEKKIKELFGKQETFCEKYGYKYKGFAAKKRTMQKQVNDINKFLEPINLVCVIIEKKYDFDLG